MANPEHLAMQIILLITREFNFVQIEKFTLGKDYAFAQKQKSKLLKHQTELEFYLYPTPQQDSTHPKVEQIKKLISSFVITVNGEFQKLMDHFTPQNAELKNKKENAFLRKTVSKLQKDLMLKDVITILMKQCRNFSK